MIITGFDLNSVLMQTKQLFGGGGCTSVIVAILVAVAGGLILFFVKRCFGHLDENDKRIEGSVKKLNSWAFGIDKRVSRIEGHLKISPFSSASPIELTNIGKEILNKSGIKEIVDQFKLQLIEAIGKYNTSTAYDTQESTRRVFQEFNFGEENLKKLKEYSFTSGQWGLSDILDVGAIYFRDVALEKFGHEHADLDKKPKEPA